MFKRLIFTLGLLAANSALAAKVDRFEIYSIPKPNDFYTKYLPVWSYMVDNKNNIICYSVEKNLPQGGIALSCMSLGKVR